MASCRECNQRVVLKVTALVYVPVLVLTDVSDKPPRLPPVGHRRLPPDRGQLKKGDEVVTVGGIVGEVIHIKDDRVTVKSGESRLVVRRDRISDIQAAGGTDVSSAPASKQISS